MLLLPAFVPPTISFHLIIKSQTRQKSDYTVNLQKITRFRKENAKSTG